MVPGPTARKMTSTDHRFPAIPKALIYGWSTCPPPNVPLVHKPSIRPYFWGRVGWRGGG